MDLSYPAFINCFFAILRNGVGKIGVGDTKLNAAFIYRFGNGFAVFNCGCKGFFRKDVFTGVSRCDYHFAVIACGCGYYNSVNIRPR
jgi:hypothetical protein